MLGRSTCLLELIHTQKDLLELIPTQQDYLNEDRGNSGTHLVTEQAAFFSWLSLYCTPSVSYSLNGKRFSKQVEFIRISIRYFNAYQREIHIAIRYVKWHQRKQEFSIRMHA